MKSILIAVLVFVGISQVQARTHTNAHSLEETTKVQVLNRVNPILRRLCSGSCKIVDVFINIQPKISDGEDMGFEATIGEVRSRELEVQRSLSKFKLIVVLQNRIKND